MIWLQYCRKRHLILINQSINYAHFFQDPFGDRRRQFDYQGILNRLSAIKKTLDEKITKNSSDDETSDIDTDSSTNR